MRHLKVAAIGPATRQAIEQHGVKVNVVPKEYVAESVVASLRRKVKGKRVLLARAKVARDVIPRELRKLGARVDVVEAYETVIPQSSRQRLRAALKSQKRRPDWITFTSSSTVRNFVALLGGKPRPGRPRHTGKEDNRVRFASIGPVTSSTLRELGLPVDVEAAEYTIPGLIKAISSEEVGLRTTRSACNSSGLVILVVSFGSAQTTSSDFPPDELLQRITVDGLRAHMAFLADDLLEGRGTGTRGYQLAANYVRAQFEEMGLKPAGVGGSYFQNVRFRRIELLRDKSSFAVKQNNGSTRTLTIEKDYVMGGDPLSADTTAEGQVVFVGYGVSAPEFNYDDYAGIDVRGKIVAALYGAPPKMPSAPGAHFSSSEQKLRMAAEHGAIGYISIWAGKTEQRTPFSEYVRFTRGPSLRWLDEKGVPNGAEPKYPRCRADKFQHGGAAVRRRAEIVERRAARRGEQPAASLSAGRQCDHAHRQPLLGGGESRTSLQFCRARIPSLRMNTSYSPPIWIIWALAIRSRATASTTGRRTMPRARRR